MKEIYAIIPIYEKGLGNIVEVYFYDKTVKLSYSLDSYIRKIFKSRLLNYEEEKNIIRKFLNIKKNLPIWTREEIFCMVKVRKPLAKNDGSFGAFNIHAIEAVDNGRILLNNGKSIRVLESIECIEDRIYRAGSAEIFLKKYISDPFC